MADQFKRAAHLADDRGMTLVQCPTDAGLARIACTTCGWPHTGFDVMLEQYARAPHGCHPCRWSAEHGLLCPGLHQRQERAL